VTAWLDPVRAALDDAPAPVEVFFRDDDAGWDDTSLFALVRQFRERGLPLDLAAIPTALSPQTAGELRREPLLGFHQHGYAHANHEPTGRSCEFGASRTYQQQRNDIAAGIERLERLLGDAVDPIFTPPWNRCTPVTADCLVELGFRTVSREARAERFGRDELRELPVDVDWLKRRHGVPLRRAEVAALLAGALRARTRVGVMFHHAVMDAASFAAAAQLLDVLAAHPSSRPVRMAALDPLTTTEVFVS